MKIYLPPHDMTNDLALIERFHDAMWAFYEGQVLELRKELQDIQCPEIEIYCAFRYEGKSTMAVITSTSTTLMEIRKSSPSHFLD